MEEQLSVLKVRMFGRAIIAYGESPIPFGRQSVTKVQKLLLLLLYQGSDGIARNRLIEELYGREEVLDVSNNLRVTSYRLKKAMIEAGLPEYDYITVKNGIYYWTCPMEMEVDALIFRKLIRQASETDDKEEKCQLLKQACEMYAGEFLQELSDEEWVLIESVQYKKLYAQSLSWLCSYLKEKGEYEEILRFCSIAAEIYPFDEWQAVKIDCFIAQGRYKEAFKEYEETEKLFIEELGISPSEGMMNQLNIIRGGISSKPHVITEIKDRLKEEDESSGAYYCSLPSFRDEYCFACRIMERNGQSMYLMLCTIIDSKGYPQEDKEMLQVMSEKLQTAIKKSLRRCDTFTRYSMSQFLILLVGLNGESCERIFDRIVRRFSEENKSWKNYLCCDTFSVSAQAPENSREELKQVN